MANSKAFIVTYMRNMVTTKCVIMAPNPCCAKWFKDRKDRARIKHSVLKSHLPLGLIF